MKRNESLENSPEYRDALDARFRKFRAERPYGR